MDTTPTRAAHPGNLTLDTPLRDALALLDPAPPAAPAPVVVEVEDEPTELTPWGRPNALERAEDARAAARTRHAPIYATAGTLAAGYTAWGACEAAAAFGAGGTAVAATVAVSAAALPILRRRFRLGIPDAWRRRWWLSAVAGAGWVDLAAATMTPGAALAMGAGAVVGSAVLHARWMDERRVPNLGDLVEPEQPALPAPEPEWEPSWPEPEPVDMSRAAQIETAWYSRAADPEANNREACARGGRLTGRDELPNGSQWLVELDDPRCPGTTEFLGMVNRLAKIFGVKPSHVLIERLEGDDDREDRALLTVVTKDVLGKGVPYLGPAYEDGVIPIGKYCDGSGIAPWRAEDNTGPLNGLVIGSKGSGKSNVLAQLGMGYKEGGWFVAFGDGDPGGNSSPLLREVADDFAKGDEVLDQMAAFETWYRVRGAFMGDLTEGPDGEAVPITDPARQKPVDKIKPSRAFPGHIWVIDELHRLLKRLGRAFADRLEALARIIRKYGGAIIAGTQGGHGKDFAGNMELRTLLLDNLIMLRSKNKSEKHSVSDLGASPSTLPLGGGYCFIDNGGRLAMARIAFSDDMADWVPELPQVQVDPRSAKAYARHRKVQPFDPIEYNRQVKEEMAKVDAALDSGTPLPGEATDAKAGVAEGKGSAPTSVGGHAIPKAPGRATSPATVTPLHPGTTDPDLLAHAAELVVTAQFASPSMLQRKLRVGYAQAAELITQLQERGVVGPPREGREREVLVERDDLADLLAGLGAPAVDDGDLPANARRVLEVMRSQPRPWRTSELAEATGLSLSAASTACTQHLAPARLAHQPTGKNGTYAAGPAPSSATGT